MGAIRVSSITDVKVSAQYRIGKLEPFNLLHNKREYGMLNLFLNSGSTHEEIQ